MTVASKELTPLKASQTEFVDARPIDEGIISSIYSFVKKAAVVGCVYIVGYMGWSVAWLIGPVILSVVKDQWRKESDRKRNDAKVIAQTDEKRVILARLNDLPSWVSCSIRFFTTCVRLTVTVGHRYLFTIILIVDFTSFWKVINVHPRHVENKLY